MEWLNYHHFLYFWMVAREGSVSKAAQKLRLAQSSVSAQVRALEESLGERLFSRAGRSLVLTDVGRVALRYAEEIFGLGREFIDVVKRGRTPRGIRFAVGIVDVLPKLIAYRLLQPALHLEEPMHLVFQEDHPEQLLGRLAVHELDLVLSDAPIGPGLNIRGYSHLLGECGIAFFAKPDLARRYRRDFPRSLDGAPYLMPGEQSVLGRQLHDWFQRGGLAPRVLAEFDDSALLKVFGQAGAGIFAAPSAIEEEIVRQYGVRVVGRTDEIRERFYAISVERRIKHPAVLAIANEARKHLFVESGAPLPDGSGRDR